MMIKLVAFLGNPGTEYELTRHNVAWLVLDYLCDQESISLNKKYKGEYSPINIGGEPRHLIRPLTFMNLSGESVQKISQFYKIRPEEILVVHDELDLPFGQIQFKKGGGVAGHNGLKSIRQCHGNNQDFLRLRIGIDRPVHGNVSSYVLSKFSANEMDHLEDLVEISYKAISEALKNGFEKSSSLYSKKNILNKG